MSDGKYEGVSDRAILEKAYEHALRAKKNSSALLWIVIINTIIAILF